MEWNAMQKPLIHIKKKEHTRCNKKTYIQDAIANLKLIIITRCLDNKKNARCKMLEAQ